MLELCVGVAIGAAANCGTSLARGAAAPPPVRVLEPSARLTRYSHRTQLARVRRRRLLLALRSGAASCDHVAWAAPAHAPAEPSDCCSPVIGTPSRSSLSEAGSRAPAQAACACRCPPSTPRSVASPGLTSAFSRMSHPSRRGARVTPSSCSDEEPLPRSANHPPLQQAEAVADADSQPDSEAGSAAERKSEEGVEHDLEGPMERGLERGVQQLEQPATPEWKGEASEGEVERELECAAGLSEVMEPPTTGGRNQEEISENIEFSSLFDRYLQDGDE
eukprot:Hpha_TRINITY_DN14447_c0_g1::TRINITY_DN14447_c0_g1_i1::g.157206::m.157206